jgi:hypothetical protein
VGRDRGVGLGLGVGGGVGVPNGGVGGGVTVGVGVTDAVGVGGIVGVGVDDSHPITTSSTLQPSLEPLESLAMRQRKTIEWPAKPIRSTAVRMKPPELPVHAWRPARGLPQQVLIVPL